MNSLYFRKKYSIALVILLAFLMQIPLASFSNYSVADEELGIVVDGGGSVADSVYEEVVVEEPSLGGGDSESDVSEEEEESLGVPKMLPMGMLPLGAPELEFTSVKIYDEKPTWNDTEGKLDINGSPVEDVRIDMTNRVAIIYTWTLPDGHAYTNGSTYTFQLPDKFSLGAGLSGDLDGEVGTYTVSSSGEVTFTFNNNIVTGQEEKGYFYLYLNFDENKIKDGELEQKITFDPPGTEITVHFNNPNVTNNKMNKTGVGSSEMNPSYIDWEVDFNLNEENISDAKFQDKFPSKLTLIYPVQLIPLTVKLNGDKVKGTPISFDAPGTKEGKELKVVADGFEIELGSINKAFRVKYSTKVAPITVSPYHASLENNANLFGNSVSEPLFSVKNSVTVKFSKPLSKFYKAYDSAKQEIIWKIEYNFNEQTIAQANAWIEDKFDITQELVAGSIQVIKQTIGLDGNGTPNGGALDASEYTVTDISDAGNSGFKLYFNNVIQNAYEIIYKTKTKERVFDDSVTINNSVKMHDESSANASHGIGQVIFRKDSTDIDYANKTITWRIRLNYDKQVMKNVVITDTFEGQNLTFLPDTLEITGMNSSDYEVSTVGGHNTDFKITFNSPINKTSHDITFKTKYDSTQIPPSKKYTNNGRVDWQDTTDAYKNKEYLATRPLDAYSGDNGNKTGAYDAQNKKITWTIDVNYNLHNIGKAIVKDSYTGEHFCAGFTASKSLKSFRWS